jgi:RNA polymerase sigma-70 factor, ECF subfamily
MHLDPDATDEGLLAHYVDASRPVAEREVAFHQLVRRHQRRVYAVCVQVLGHGADAEDATQETFLRLARGAGSFRGDARLSTWLFRVARNVATDHVRYDARRPVTPVADVTRVGGDTADADRTAATDTVLSMRAALAQLDERSRTLLVLVAVEGLSYAEAAAAVGMPVGTVKSRVSRARVRLGELLVDLDREAPAPPGGAGRDAPPSGPDPGEGASVRGPPP